MGKMKDLAIQGYFLCECCEMNLPQSPTMPEMCIPCAIDMLYSDILLNRAALEEADR